MIPETLEKDVRQAYRSITLELIRRGLVISTMESCTGGLIASLITDTEGASAVLRGAFVTYSNEAKIRQGVPAEVIEKYSVYSKETAAAMADACRRAYGADIGIGVTGTFGNIDPENPAASEPGKVYFSVSTEKAAEAQEILLPPMPSRYEYKLITARTVAEALTELLV